MGKVNMMNMDWINWKEYEAPKNCWCGDIDDNGVCSACDSASDEFVAKQAIELCAKYVEKCSGNILPQVIAAGIRDLGKAVE
jgi:hypothetical protein